MPYPDPGKVGYFLGGGACILGPHQATQIVEVNKVFPPQIVAAQSVGGYNSLDLENALLWWKKYFFSASQIYEPHDDLKKVIALLRKMIPHRPRWTGYRNLREFIYDINLQTRHSFQILSFGIRAIRTLLTILSAPQGGAPSLTQLFPPSALQELITLLKAWKLNHLESIFDLAPLFENIRNHTDHKVILNPSFNRLLLARHGDKLHIFARYPEESLSGRYPDRFHLIRTWEEHETALRATSALQPFFARPVIDGKIFNDPGTFNPFPVEYLFDAGCDTVFAFVKDYAVPPAENDILNRTLAQADFSLREWFTILRERAELRAEREGKKLHIITQQPPHPNAHLITISPEVIEYAETVEKKAMDKFLKKLLT